MKRVCFIITSAHNGGTETYLLRFLKHYSNKLDITILASSCQEGELYDQFIELGASYVPFKIGYFNPLDWLKLSSFFKRNKFDAVCDLRAEVGGITMLMAWLAGIKRRSNFYRHSSFLFPPTASRIFYMRRCLSLTNMFATDILANSKSAFDFFFPSRKDTDSRFEVIQNGVDSALFESNQTKAELKSMFGLPQDKFIVGHTGRVTPAKNHETILKVAREFEKIDKNIVFVLAGRATEELEIGSNVIALGNCQQVPKLLQAFDLYYFPSVTEGQPNALIEAMIAGLPFVASDINPIKECVPQQHHWQLCNATDVANTVAQLKKMIAMSDRANATCREWATDHYQIDKNFKKFFDKL